MGLTTKWKTTIGMRDVLLTGVLFAWLYQLLTPLGWAGGVPNMNGFYVFVGVLLLLELIMPVRWVKIGLQLVTLFVFMHYFFSSSSLWDIAWLKHILQEVWSGAVLILQRQYADITEIPRTFGFLLFLWLTTIVYRSAIQSRVWLFILLFIGEVVIGVIDTFFSPDASGYIVRYFLIGFIMLALSQLPVLEKLAQISHGKRGWPIKWIVWTLVVPLLAVGVGMAAPKYPPSWPDPITFVQGKASSMNQIGAKKIGYGADDSALGGPYQMDDTVAFTVITDQPGYYRGESKSMYTGKGWVSIVNLMPVASNDIGAQISLLDSVRNPYGVNQNTHTKEVEQEIHIENTRLNVVLGQYQVSSVEAIQAAGGGGSIPIKGFSPENWSLRSELSNGTSYKVTSQVPYYDPDKYKLANDPGQMADASYFILPESVTARVRQLAQDITANQATPYDKAKAIEQYLRTNYTYEITDVPFPAPDQDFVDQFLFESKKGYCDHFSSAMVVLARSAGLPSRWVKGFAQGEQDSSFTSDDEKKRYIVRNKDAHSWAEVKIPGVGWLPFEPTATFSQPVILEELPVGAPAPSPEQPQPQQPEQPQDQTDTSVTPTFEIDWQKLGMVMLGMIGVIGVTAYLLRKRLWVAFYLRRSVGTGQDDRSLIIQGMERLFKILHRFGWQRKSDLTVREFGSEMNRKGYRGREWLNLVQIFERVRYGNKSAQKKDVGEIKKLWERIIRKIGRTNWR